MGGYISKQLADNRPSSELLRLKNRKIVGKNPLKKNAMVAYSSGCFFGELLVSVKILNKRPRAVIRVGRYGIMSLRCFIFIHFNFKLRVFDIDIKDRLLQ